MYVRYWSFRNFWNKLIIKNGDFHILVPHSDLGWLGCATWTTHCVLLKYLKLICQEWWIHCQKRACQKLLLVKKPWKAKTNPAIHTVSSMAMVKGSFFLWLWCLGRLKDSPKALYFVILKCFDDNHKSNLIELH